MNTRIATIGLGQKINIRRFLLIGLALQVIASLILRYFSYIGTDDPALMQEILRYFTVEDVAQGLRYQRAGFAAALAGTMLSFTLVYVFVFTPLSRKIEEFFVIRSRGSFMLLCFYFLTTYFLIHTILFLPFKYYFGFVQEHQFGFSHMTLGEWVVLTLKNIAVQFVLTIPFEMGALVVLKRFSRSWPVILPAASLLVGLVMTAIWPLVITPIFYDYEPLAEGSLKEKIVALVESSSITVESIYKINESRYSGHTNAYFVGWGDNKKIFIYDTLITQHTEDEVVNVLAHEIGHWQHNHSLKGIILSSVLLFFGSLVVMWVFNVAKTEGRMFLTEICAPSTFPLVYFIFSFLSFIIAPLQSYHSRVQETDADDVALTLTNDAQSFIDAHIKIARVNKGMLNPHPLVVWYYYSHPPTIQRIERGEAYKNR